MNPTIGRIVHYRLTEAEATRINARRTDAENHRKQIPFHTGFVAHTGNVVAPGDVFPMMITRVWDNPAEVNGQAFLDGNDTLWVTSVNAGPEDALGTYSWPVRA